MLLRRILLPTGVEAAGVPAMTTFAGAASTQLSVTHQTAGGVEPGAHPATICYTQNASPAGDAVNSQKYNPAYNIYNDTAADDFALTAACAASSVDISGAYFNGAGPMPRVRVTFYSDAGGKPGSPIATRLVLSSAPGYTDTSGTLHVPLSPLVSLPASTTLWMSVRSRMNVAGGEWGWDTTTVLTGSPAVWRQPLGGFGIGCPAWTNMQTCTGTIGPDLMFAVNS
jgi:hypothetical protein